MNKWWPFMANWGHQKTYHHQCQVAYGFWSVFESIWNPRVSIPHESFITLPGFSEYPVPLMQFFAASSDCGYWRTWESKKKWIIDNFHSGGRCTGPTPLKYPESKYKSRLRFYIFGWDLKTFHFWCIFLRLKRLPVIFEGVLLYNGML